MLIEYKRKFNLRINDFDCHDNILMSSVLDLFQGVAGDHANILGIGFEEFKKKNKLWVVIRTKFEVYKQPIEEETITVRTWPLVPGKIDANRCYEILSENGEVLIRGISKWVNVDMYSRRILRMNDWTYGEGEFDEDYGLTSYFDKIQDFDAINGPIKVTPSYLDLDHNGHINNSKYTNFILNNVKELHDKEIVFCQIEHISELKRDQTFDLYYTIKDKEFLVKGVVEDSISFIAKIRVKY